MIEPAEVLAELLAQDRATVSGTVAIAGVALSDVGRVDDKGPYELMAQASRRALAEAGLSPADVDGSASTGQGTLPPADVGEYLGLRPTLGGLDRGRRRLVGGDGRARGRRDRRRARRCRAADLRLDRPLRPAKRVCAEPTSTGAPAARCSGRRRTATP